MSRFTPAEDAIIMRAAAEAAARRTHAPWKEACLFTPGRTAACLAKRWQRLNGRAGAPATRRRARHVPKSETKAEHAAQAEPKAVQHCTRGSASAGTCEATAPARTIVASTCRFTYTAFHEIRIESELVPEPVTREDRVATGAVVIGEAVMVPPKQMASEMADISAAWAKQAAVSAAHAQVLASRIDGRYLAAQRRSAARRLAKHELDVALRKRLRDEMDHERELEAGITDPSALIAEIGGGSDDMDLLLEALDL
jgi:hypothetical protein